MSAGVTNGFSLDLFAAACVCAFVPDTRGDLRKFVIDKRDVERFDVGVGDVS